MAESIDPELQPAAYVVLGMVRLGARSGYQIKRMVDDSIRFFWTISPVQVYPSLKQLERAGYVTGQDEPSGNRRRRVYEITPSGEAALNHWLLAADPMPFELRDVAMVKLFFADSLRPGQARELLHAVRARSALLVATLEAIRPDADAAKSRGNLFPELTLDMGVAFHTVMQTLCDRFESELSNSAGGQGETT